MSDSGPRYDHAARAAAHIVNLLAGDAGPGKTVLFGKILVVVLDAMQRADDERAQRMEPSVN